MLVRTNKHTHSLESNWIGDLEAQAIAASLVNANNKLETLHLKLNHIGKNGADDIATALVNANCNIQTLK